jgi:hypothetical protein
MRLEHPAVDRGLRYSRHPRHNTRCSATHTPQLAPELELRSDSQQTVDFVEVTRDLRENCIA